MTPPSTIERFTTDDGVGLHVEFDGDSAAPPLVLVNGAMCATPVWENVLDRLAATHHVIRHDVRGTGRSDPGPDDSYTFERYAADIVGLCDHLDLAAPRIWGMAWGARVALVTAAEHTARFERIVLSDLAIDPADPEAQRAGALAAAAARKASGVPEAPRPDGWNRHDDPDEAAMAIAATRAHPDLLPFVERVTAPVLVITGEHDPNLTSSRRAVESFTDARLVVVGMSGHGLVRQRPTTTVELVLPFLLATSPSRTTRRV